MDYTRAIEFNPNEADYYSNRGNAKKNQGKYEEVIADYSKVIELDPKNAIAYHNRGIAKNKLAKYEEAV